jgi:type IV pilus assembly protein PilE
MRAKQTGFTLIEILIVVAILGILATVAYPSYTQYLVRGRVMEGTSTLADQRVRLEQFYQDNRNYGTGACGTDAGGTARVALTATKYFTYTCALGAGGQSYTITAASIAATSGGAAGDWSYTITDRNVRATTKYKGTTSTAQCWQVKQSESC